MWRKRDDDEHTLFSDFLDIGQPSSFLHSEVGGSDECVQDVLWQHESEGCHIILDIIIGNIDMLQTKW